ncbi:MAG: REP-associated tyrosine transposase [Terriglobales bacterium]
MKPKYAYRRRLPHIQKDNRPIFITFTTDRRWVLPAEARDIVLESCVKENGKKFELHTGVVMPDHTHLLLSPLRDCEGWNFSLPQIMHAIKGVSARKINLLLARHGPVWQEDFFDHVLRSNDSLAEKVNYICQNPVRAGLVKTEAEYRWLWRGTIPIRSENLAAPRAA